MSYFVLTTLPFANVLLVLRLLLLLLIIATSAFRWLPKEGESSYLENGALAGSYILPRYEAKIEDIPYHVLVFYKQIFCSGSIINSRVVITCASCFFKRNNEPTYVKVGSNIMTERSQIIKALRIKKHEFYRRMSEVDNDIAIVFLEKNVRFGPTVKKILLAEPEVSLRFGCGIQVSGYGADNVPQKLRNHLLSTTFVVADNDFCHEHYGSLLTGSTFCAKYLPDRLLSDNGGGATLQNFLVGVLVSGGIAKDDPPFLAIFTNISYFYRWISLNTRRCLEEFCVPAEQDEYSTYEEFEDDGVLQAKQTEDMLMKD